MRGRLSQPVRVAGAYLLVSLVWILASDNVVAFLVRDRGTQLLLNTAKGWAFVAITTVILYGVLERERRAAAAEARVREESRQRVERIGHLYRVLGETGEALFGLAEGKDILPEACRIAVEVAGLRMAWVGMVDPASGLVEPAASAGHVDGYFDGLSLVATDVAAAQGPSAWAIVTGATVTVADVATDPMIADFRDRALSRGYRSVAAAPLRRGGEVVGAFIAYASEPDYFAPEIVEVFDRIAGAVSFGLEFQRREGERRDAFAKLEAYGAELEARVAERTEELRAAAERLAESDNAKSRFLANMSHELRTPLNSIIGFTGVLLQGLAGELNPEQTRQLEMVRRSGNYLLGLVNDVLDLSRIEAGRVRLDRSRFDLRTVAEQAAETLRPLAAEKSLALAVDLPGSQLIVNSDRARLLQILLNLLSNAVKFTGEGEVRIAVRTVGRSKWAVSVSDTGPGIPPGQLEAVFEEFYQVERVDGEKARGTGLGLTITRRLVEMIGARLLVRSAPGEGSVFEVIGPMDVTGGEK